jgi:hypothetical protein
MLTQMLAAWTVLASLFCESRPVVPAGDASLPPAGGAGRDELTTCTTCRMDFMKCVASGADLPSDARKEKKRECADLAAQCFQRCTRGAVFTEYLVIVGVCAIVVAGAIASLGIPLLTGYGAARQVLIAPTP